MESGKNRIKEPPTKKRKDEKDVKEKKGQGRSPNWSSGEKMCLVNAVEPVFAKLFGKFSTGISIEVKTKCWVDITNRVSHSC
jgi:hypothetical protein